MASADKREKRTRSGGHKQSLSPGQQDGHAGSQDHPASSKRRKPSPEQETVPCTYCDGPVPALKTCLQCEASFCSKHLEKHRSSSGHLLIEPTASLAERKCSKHEEVLKYHCVKDDAYICSSCHVAGLHKGHKVESLEVCAEKKKKSLKLLLKTLEEEKQKTEKRISTQNLQNKSGERKVEEIERKVKAKTKDMIKALDALESKVLGELSAKRQLISRLGSDLMEQLEDQKTEISRKIEAVMELSDLTDPLTFLITERERDVSGHTVSSQPPADPQSLEISETQILQKLQHADSVIKELLGDDHPKKTELETDLPKNKKKLETDLLKKQKKLEMDLLKNQKKLETDLKKQKDQEIDLPQKWTESEITLDDETAHCDIIISDNLRTAQNTPKKNKKSLGAQDKEERFKSPHVMSVSSFSSGNHYWEVDLKGTQKCIIGVAYRSLVQMPETPFSDIGRNDQSWGLYIEFSEKLIRSYHNRNQVRILTDSDVASFGISLEYDAGRLTFYQLTNPRRHLHAFSATFTEPLHACFYLYKGCVITIRE